MKTKRQSSQIVFIQERLELIRFFDDITSQSGHQLWPGLAW